MKTTDLSYDDLKFNFSKYRIEDYRYSIKKSNEEIKNLFYKNAERLFNRYIEDKEILDLYKNKSISLEKFRKYIDENLEDLIDKYYDWLLNHYRKEATEKAVKDFPKFVKFIQKNNIDYPFTIIKMEE